MTQPVKVWAHWGIETIPISQILLMWYVVLAQNGTDNVATS